MQILQCLLKTAQEQPTQTDNNSSAASKKKEATKGDRKAKSKDVIVVKNPSGGGNNRKKTAAKTGLDCSSLNFFKILRRKDIAKACFYGTIHLNTRKDFVNSMKMKKEDLARGFGENKVLPITDNQNGNETDHGASKTAVTKEKAKGDHKAKTLSKMKELLRWAATAKAEKGGKYISRKVMQFRNRAALKSVLDDEQMSNDSPKISFRWELESCSTVSSSYSAISSIASSSVNFDQASIGKIQNSLMSTPIHDSDGSIVRAGNWITTDSEFVVLEL